MATVIIGDTFPGEPGTVEDSKVSISYKDFLVDVSKYLGFSTSSFLTSSNINFFNRIYSNDYMGMDEPYVFSYNLNILSSSYTKTQTDVNNFFALYSATSYYTSYVISGVDFPLIIQPQTSSKGLNCYVFPYDTFEDQYNPPF